MADITPEPVGVRIGALSRRVGISAEALRSWERRYGVLQPARSPSGYRLYGTDDQRRAQRMKELIDAGHAPAEAARALAVAGLDPTPSAPAGARITGEREALQAALLTFDAAGAHARLDRLLGAHTVDVVLRDVVIPLLRDLGTGWERARVSIAQEHFASELLGGRLRSMGSGWDGGLGPRALLACPAGERHDLGLLCCAIALHRRGWRVTYLGADTPVEEIEEVADLVGPGIVVLSAVAPEPLALRADALAAISERRPVALGGAGAHPSLALRAGAQLLRGDPVTAARELTAAHPR